MLGFVVPPSPAVQPAAQSQSEASPHAPAPCNARHGCCSCKRGSETATPTTFVPHSKTYWHVVSVFLIMHWLLVDKRSIYQAWCFCQAATPPHPSFSPVFVCRVFCFHHFCFSLLIVFLALMFIPQVHSFLFSIYLLVPVRQPPTFAARRGFFSPIAHILTPF